MSTRPHQESQSPCSWRDMVWGFVLGSASAEEDAAFREHLLEGCAHCGDELKQARSVVGDLDLAVARRTLQRGYGSRARPEIRARLLDEYASKRPTPFGTEVGESAKHLVPTSFAGISLVSDSDRGWRTSSVEGVEFKTLVEDKQRRTATVLVRMAPGSSYPGHRHGAREECYVLEGDITFGEHRMTAGDFQVAEEGSVHPVQTTEEGCLLLIVSSLDDELEAD